MLVDLAGLARLRGASIDKREETVEEFIWGAQVDRDVQFETKRASKN
jgi:hypothetical protein